MEFSRQEYWSEVPLPSQHEDWLAFIKVWGLLPVFSRCSVQVVPHEDVLLMYFWGGRWSWWLNSPPSSLLCFLPFLKKKRKINLSVCFLCFALFFNWYSALLLCFLLVLLLIVGFGFWVLLSGCFHFFLSLVILFLLCECVCYIVFFFFLICFYHFSEVLPLLFFSLSPLFP